MSDSQDHAKRWTTAIVSDTDAVLDLYADELQYDDRRDFDHVVDSPTSKVELRERLVPFAGGNHAFEVLEVLESLGDQGSRAVTFLWKWTGENLDSYRGVPTGGRTLSTRGQTWHQLDADGRIVRESTFWNDTPVLQELGLPVATVHYWDADFDPATAFPS